MQRHPALKQVEWTPRTQVPATQVLAGSKRSDGTERPPVVAFFCGGIAAANGLVSDGVLLCGISEAIMTQRSTVKQHLVNAKIDDVLTRAGLPLTSPLRDLLDREAEVVDNGREFYVHVPRPDRDISLSELLEEVRGDAMFLHHFPKDAPRVAKNDMRQMSDSFDDIVSGKVKVE